MTYKDYCQDWEEYYMRKAEEEPHNRRDYWSLADVMRNQSRTTSPDPVYYSNFANSCEHELPDNSCDACNAWIKITAHKRY